MKDERYYKEIEFKFEYLINKKEEQDYISSTDLEAYKEIIRNNELSTDWAYEYIKNLIKESLEDIELLLLLDKWKDKFKYMVICCYASNYLINKVEKNKKLLHIS